VTDEPHADPRVFLSYASQDAAVAQRLCAALEGAGQRCWIAPRDVKAGEAYAAAIVQAINSCRMLVLLLSRSAIDSPHVLREVERASSKKRPVLAVRLDTSELPPELEYFLSANQWLDASQGALDQVIPALIESVRGQGRAASAMAKANVARGEEAIAAAVRSRSGLGARAMPVALSLVALVLAYLLVDKFWLSRQATIAAPAAAPLVTATIPAISDKSIAVLPFADLSEHKDQEYFSDGLSEDLIDLLTKVPELLVPARASSFYFKGQHTTIAEIARALAVTYVLEGSVRKAGNTVRVRTELIRADNGYNVWSETYDRDLKDIFKVQDEIAGRVVAALKVALPGGAKPVNADQRTGNTEAYNQYLLGQHFDQQYDEAGFRRSVDAFKKAIALDPHYAAAYAGLAFAEASLSDKIGDPTGVARATAAAEQAIALAPNDPEGYGARGWLRTAILWDWDGAAQDFTKVASIDAERFLTVRADLAVAQGRGADALVLQKRYVQSNPLNALEWSSLAGMLIDAGDLSEARRTVQRALEIDPGFSVAKLHLVELELLEGHLDQALADAQGIKDRDWKLQCVALAEHSLHHAKESQQALYALINDSSQAAAYQIAEVYAWQGDKDRAFDWLDRAYRQHDGGMIVIKTDWILKPLRSDPRYAELLRRLKLPP
jgi:TolB-like protein/Flp pilus assembly protein TadD